MIPSIYNIPGLFRLSTLVFEIPDTTQPETVDRLGNPVRATRRIVLTMQLDRAGNQRNRPDTNYGAFSETENIYEGHLVVPDDRRVQELQTELGMDVEIWQSDTLPPEIAEGATTTEGDVNGQTGTVRLLPTEQTAILAPYQAGFSDRVRVELIKRQQWQGNG